MKQYFAQTALVATLSLTVGTAALAQNFGDVARAEILPGWRMDNGNHMAGLLIELEPGWKTYWRAPGDAGIPPRFAWEGSTNVGTVALHFPVPGMFADNGLTSVGYAEDIVIPLEIAVSNPGQPAQLGGQIDVGVCEEVCIPMRFEVSSVLPASGSAAGSDAIRAAVANPPMTAREAGLGAVTCKTDPIDDGMRVTVSVDMAPLGQDEAMVVEFADPTVWVSSATSSRDGGRLVSQADLVPSNAAPFALSRQDLRFTVLAGGKAVDIRGCQGG